MLAASVLPLDSHSVEPLGAVRPTPPETIDPTPVLRRNMFDHETGRLDIDEPPPEEIVEDDTPPEEVDPTRVPRHHRDLVLDAARHVFEADGVIHPSERAQFELLEQLLC